MMMSNDSNSRTGMISNLAITISLWVSQPNMSMHLRFHCWKLYAITHPIHFTHFYDQVELVTMRDLNVSTSHDDQPSVLRATTPP